MASKLNGSRPHCQYSYGLYSFIVMASKLIISAQHMSYHSVLVVAPYHLVDVCACTRARVCMCVHVHTYVRMYA